MKNFNSREQPIADQLSLADEILAQQTITADGYFQNNVIELGATGEGGEDIKYKLAAWFRHDVLARRTPVYTLPSGTLRYSLKHSEQWPVDSDNFAKDFRIHDAAYGLVEVEKIVLNVCRTWSGEARYRPGHKLKPNSASYSSEETAFYSFAGRRATYSAYLGVAPSRREIPDDEKLERPIKSKLSFWRPGTAQDRQFINWQKGQVKSELEREKLSKTLQQLGMTAVLLPRQ